MGKEIGIDLGTTNTIVSYVNKYNELVTMELKDHAIIPSVIYFKSRSECVIGYRAISNGIFNPKACVKNFKSFFGKKERFKITAEDGDEFSLTAVQVAGFFLREIIKNVQDKIANEFRDIADMNFISKVVISVPAKFNPTEREAVKKAAISARLNDVALMTEPTAAAIAYVHDREGLEGKTVLVYDFGGGTFDISIMKNQNGIFSVLYTDGDEHLGGNDITDKIANYIIEEINNEFLDKGIDLELPLKPKNYNSEMCNIDELSYLTNYNKIIEVCNEQIKHRLSDGKNEFYGEIPIIIGKKDDGRDERYYYEYKYSLEQINELIEDEIERTVDITRTAIEWSATRKNENPRENNIKIDRIILAGGSSQIPMIKQMLEQSAVSEYDEQFGNIPVISDDDVSTLISRGAAIMANENYRASGVKEKTNYEYGVQGEIGAVLDAFDMIIPDNEDIPCHRCKTFKIKDDFDNLEIKIYTRNAKSKNKRNITIRSKAVQFIDELIIENIPKDKNRTVEIDFTINQDGSLSIQADIKAGEKIISKNHKIQKGSNLLC